MQTRENGQLTLKEAQEKVDNWIKQYGVRYFNKLTNFAILAEEVGEFGRIVARKYGEQSFKKDETENTEEEMADILFVLICMANQMDIDLEEALQKNLHKKTSRDQKRHRANPKLKNNRS